MNDWSKLSVPNITKMVTVVGPRSSRIHYAHAAHRLTLCNRLGTWRVTTDDENNRNRSGFCPACMRKAPY